MFRHGDVLLEAASAAVAVVCARPDSVTDLEAGDGGADMGDCACTFAAIDLRDVRI